MRRIELAVPRVVRIQIKAIQAVAVAGLHHQPVKEAGLALGAVEIEIDDELPGRLVEDVQRPVEIADEQAARAAGLFTQGVHPRQQHLVRCLAADRSGDRHDDEVLDLERYLRRRRWNLDRAGRKGEARGPNRVVHESLST